MNNFNFLFIKEMKKYDSLKDFSLSELSKRSKVLVITFDEKHIGLLSDNCDFIIIDPKDPKPVDENKLIDHNTIVVIGGNEISDTAKKAMAKIENDFEYIYIPTFPLCGIEASDLIDTKDDVDLAVDRLLPDMICLITELNDINNLYKFYISSVSMLGMLLESYISDKSSLLTDDLVLRCLVRIKEKLLNIDEVTPEVLENYGYINAVSGMCLSNTGLNLLGKLSGIISRKYGCDMSQVVASLIYPVTLISMQRVQIYDPFSDKVEKFCKLGSEFSGIGYDPDKSFVLFRSLSEFLKGLDGRYHIPKLSELDCDKQDFFDIISELGDDDNPVKLGESDIIEILEMAY